MQAVIIVPYSQGYNIEIRDGKNRSIVAVINKNHISTAHKLSALDVAETIRDSIEARLKKQ